MSKICVGLMSSMVALMLAISGSSAMALEQDAEVIDGATAETQSVPPTASGNKIAQKPFATIASAKDETAVPSIFPTSVVMVSTTDTIPGY